MMRTRITDLFSIEHPIIQGGMVWVAGYKLASAVSNAGGLGLIGAGSMKPELLEEHVQKCAGATRNPFGVNVPLLREDARALLEICFRYRVPIVFTSAGNPSKYIDAIKEHGILAVHVASSVKQALKVEAAGYDAVVAEGFEAGGHNGVDEISTFCLVPQVVDAVSIPVIAAGGIADGRGMLAALCLGAEGVQLGTRFAATVESSGHPVFKDLIKDALDTSTLLTLKKIGPARLLKTPFSERAMEMELNCDSTEDFLKFLGNQRERSGMFEGNIDDGQFEAGQCAGLIHDVCPAGLVVEDILSQARNQLDILISEVQ
jgi:enoyl-[acyl-carrier protein] reductase II